MSTNKYDNQFNKKFSTLKIKLDKKEKRISDIMDKALSTNRTDSAFWNGIKTQLNKEYQEINALCSEWAMVEIPSQYKFVLREQMSKAKSLKSITNKAKKAVKSHHKE